MRLLELELARALLAVGVGFGGAVGVDGFLREVVGASAGGDEGCPAVAAGAVSGDVLCYGLLCYGLLCYGLLCCGEELRAAE
jgi:hypothetical protein